MDQHNSSGHDKTPSKHIQSQDMTEVTVHDPQGIERSACQACPENCCNLDMSTSSFHFERLNRLKWSAYSHCSHSHPSYRLQFHVASIRYNYIMFIGSSHSECWFKGKKINGYTTLQVKFINKQTETAFGLFPYSIGNRPTILVVVVVAVILLSQRLNEQHQ